jgi:hypothetical protein
VDAAHRSQNFLALKWCKPHKSVEEREVSWRDDAVFHKLINTCVENLISQKYFFVRSALWLLFGTSFFDRRDFAVLQ